MEEVSSLSEELEGCALEHKKNEEQLEDVAREDHGGEEEGVEGEVSQHQMSLALGEIDEEIDKLRSTGRCLVPLV